MAEQPEDLLVDYGLLMGMGWEIHIRPEGGYYVGVFASTSEPEPLVEHVVEGNLSEAQELAGKEVGRLLAQRAEANSGVQST